jgi:hypothetical protein
MFLLKISFHRIGTALCNLVFSLAVLRIFSLFFTFEACLYDVLGGDLVEIRMTRDLSELV